MNISKTILAAIAVSTTVAVPIAEARVSTYNLTCNQAQNLVDSRGAAVLNTGRHTFDRFVANHTYCPPGDYIKRAYVPTRDRESCNIGYTCESYDGKSRNGGRGRN